MAVVQAKMFLKMLSRQGYHHLVTFAQANDPADKTSGCALARNILDHDEVDISRARVFAAAEGSEVLGTEICPDKEDWFGATLYTMLALYTFIDALVDKYTVPPGASSGAPVLGLRPHFVGVAIFAWLRSR